jgi:hypothetical protein
MIRKLKPLQIQDLLRLPESGMGYQFIEAETGYGYSQRNKYLVLNSQLLIDDSPQILNEVKSVFKSGYRNSLYSASEFEIRNIRLVENLSNFRVKAFSASTKTGAIHQKKEQADGVEVFTRLSVYEDDKRVDKENKRLIPGSYTTTSDDYLLCKKQNLDPVDRYALPNDELIQWVFYIQPKNTDWLQRGIVESDYGHKGGGKEVYFADGTTKDTYLRQEPY